MYSKIKSIAQDKGILVKQLEKDAGLAPNTIYRWDKNIPAADKLYRVARLLDVTVEELLA